MKNRLQSFLLIFPILIITTNNVYSQSGWLSSNTGTNYNYYSVYFADNWNGWACGQNGRIIKTSNGGDLWIQQVSGTSLTLYAISFRSVFEGIACGENGTIMKTITGGSFWSSRQSGTHAKLKSIFFITSSTGWISGDSGVILKSTNSGETWIKQSSGVTSQLNSIHFTSANTGWAVGSAGKILKTTNGGTNWTINVDLGTITTLHSVSFANSSSGYIAGEYSNQQGTKFIFFYKTISGGEWWLYQVAGVSRTIRSIHFSTPIKGWAAGDSGTILGTTNGGVNWVGLPGHTTNDLYSMMFTSERQGWISGNGGTILKTISGGYFDTLLTNRRDLGVIPLVINSSNVLTAKYRVMFRAPDTSYNILRSLNGGTSFDTIISHVSLTDTGRTFDGLMIRVKKIKFTAASPPGNYNGNVGVVKDPVLPCDSIQTRFYGWDYFPAQNRYLEGSRFVYSHIIPWQSISMSLSYPTRNTYTGFRTLLNPEDLRKVKIVFTGYEYGQKAYRFYAASAAQYMYQDMKDVPFKVYEIDETDGTPQPRHLNCAFLEFPDSVGGHFDGKWEPGADSLGGKEILYIFRSSYSPDPDSFYTIKNLLLNQPQIDVMYVWSPKLISQGLSYHIGDEFYIYPYTVTRPEIAPGYPLYYEFQTYSLIGVQQISTEVPVKFSLSQNHPNPFNPSTKIKFELPKTDLTGRADVQIKVYDVLGREIVTLVNEKLRPGIYETEFNGDNLSSGVYFYVFKAGNYIESKKMILLK